MQVGAWEGADEVPEVGINVGELVAGMTLYSVALGTYKKLPSSGVNIAKIDLVTSVNWVKVAPLSVLE